MFEVREQFNIREVSLGEFAQFLFDQEVPPEVDRSGKRSDPWYYSVDVEFDPRKLTRLYTELFKEPGFLLEKFPSGKLEQGFWAIMNDPLDCSVQDTIWSEEVEFQNRADCVRSMFHLYDKLFSIDPLETSSDMWWDALAYDWHCGNRLRRNGGEDLLMQDVMFETLERILELPSVRCQFRLQHKSL